MAHNKIFSSVFSLLLIVVQSPTQVSAATQFASHIRVRIPARSYSHGVGNPLPSLGPRYYSPRNSLQSLTFSAGSRGYPRVKPSKPFLNEDLIIQPDNGVHVSSWQYNNYHASAIPILPISPYKIDSPDPESLWPVGLLNPSLSPISKRRSEVSSDNEDPYLLEGSEATAAVRRAGYYGVYFHNIPHINSLLANQDLRVKNNLKPHRIASIRHTWPYNRP